MSFPMEKTGKKNMENMEKIGRNQHVSFTGIKKYNKLNFQNIISTFQIHFTFFISVH